MPIPPYLMHDKMQHNEDPCGDITPMYNAYPSTSWYVPSDQCQKHIVGCHENPTASQQDCSKGTHNDHGEAHECNPALAAKTKNLSSSPPFLPRPCRQIIWILVSWPLRRWHSMEVGSSSIRIRSHPPTHLPTT
jgi:hypothetical protein